MFLVSWREGWEVDEVFIAELGRAGDVGRDGGRDDGREEGRDEERVGGREGGRDCGRDEREDGRDGRGPEAGRRE